MSVPALTRPARSCINGPHQHPPIPASTCFALINLLEDSKFSSTGNAACNHYSGLINFCMGVPQNSQKGKYATKDRCMSTTKTFNFYLLCKEILHKSMGNNDISVNMELLKKIYANQLIFCIRPSPRLVSLSFNLRKL